jgi:hypothetical protein
MAEFGLEFIDKNPTTGLHGIPSILITAQGNHESILELIEYLQQEYEMTKCTERKCEWLQKSKEQLKR